jgi:hypothetical protein
MYLQMCTNNNKKQQESYKNIFKKIKANKQIKVQMTH